MKLKATSDWGLKEKLLFTLLMLLLFRMGTAIPVPYVNGTLFKQMVEQTAAGDVFTLMSMVGGTLMTMSFLSLGVLPYITASIIMQLFKVIVPKLEELHKTDEGRKRVTQWTRYLTLPLATLQAVGVVIGAPALFNFPIFTDGNLLPQLIAMFTLVAGSIISMRIGEEITLKGIGNGVSLIIFTSILVTLPGLVNSAWLANSWGGIIGFLLILAGIIGLVTFVEKSEYRIAVIYTKSSRNTKVQSSKLPVKVALAGVLPVIFAGSIMSLPNILYKVFPQDWTLSLDTFFASGSWHYTVAFLSLIVFFAFFSIILVFDVKKIANDMRVQGGFIPTIKPGIATEEYLSYVAKRLTVLGAAYLCFISLATIYLFPLTGLQQNAFGATSVIILSTVIVTFVTVIESELVTRKPMQLLTYSKGVPQGKSRYRNPFRRLSPPALKGFTR
jgi:preprotein translocase subunit SecY